MMNGEDIYELIENYQQGKLNGEELAQFELRLKHDAELQKKLEIYKVANKLVIQNRLREVKGILQNEKTGNTDKPTGNKGLILGVGVLALILGSFFIYFGKEENKTENVAVAPAQNIIKKSKREEVKELKEERSIRPEKKAPEIVESIPDTVKDFPQESVLVSDTSLFQEKVVPEGDSVSVLRQDKIKTEIEEPKLNKITSPCENQLIKAQATVSQPCLGEHNGEVAIGKVSGGHPPYIYSLNNFPENSTGVFTDLAAGMYNVEIVDKEGCKKILSDITLKPKSCRKNLHFNPNIGEELKIPVYEKAGKLSIYDKLGKLYFEKQLLESEEFMWNGQSISGELNPGYYVFVIQYEDGMVSEGSITIAQ